MTSSAFIGRSPPPPPSLGQARRYHDAGAQDPEHAIGQIQAEPLLQMPGCLREDRADGAIHKRPQPWRQREVVSEELSGHEAEQRPARPDDDRVASDERKHDRAAAVHDRNADREAEPDEQITTARKGRNRNRIVETHDDIGEHDDPNRAPQALGRVRLMLLVGARGADQPDGDPQQGAGAQNSQIGKPYHGGDRAAEGDEEQRGDTCPDDHPPAPFPRLQAAARHRDHDRVVAGQKNIDPNDLERGQPELRMRKVRHQMPDVRYQTSEISSPDLCYLTSGSYPTISFSAKNCAISLAAVSGASEPCTEFSPIERA